MNKHILGTIFVSVLLLFIISGGAIAANTIYINGSGGTLSGEFSGAYAIGSSGVGLIASDDVYVLTGGGVTTLSSAEVNTDGGGGLVSDNGSVKIKSDIIMVGLKYYYSSSRDSGVSVASLENYVGSGYKFGYYDSNRVFNEVSSTTETKVTIKPTSGTGLAVYATGTDAVLYEVSSTGTTNMLAIRPVCNYDDAVTWFAGYKYYGDFAYAILGAGKISVINVVDIEKYTMGVCGSEMNNAWPVEALKAQAVAARTYGQKSIKSSTYYYNCGFDLTNDTYCQAYSGCQNVGSNIIAAVNATSNQYLTYSGALCDALYFSSDGGATEDNYNVNGNSAHPYLAAVIDPFEAKSDPVNSFSSWTVTMTPAELGAKVGLSDVASVDITTSDVGNVIGIKFTSADGKTASLQRSYCRTSLGLNSIRFSVTRNSSGSYVFEGGGWGHNVGMSQFGAYSMAKYYNKTYKDILGFYYTGVSLSNGVL